MDADPVALIEAVEDRLQDILRRLKEYEKAPPQFRTSIAFGAKEITKFTLEEIAAWRTHVNNQ